MTAFLIVLIIFLVVQFVAVGERNGIYKKFLINKKTKAKEQYIIACELSEELGKKYREYASQMTLFEHMYYSIFGFSYLKYREKYKYNFRKLFPTDSSGCYPDRIDQRHFSVLDENMSLNQILDFIIRELLNKSYVGEVYPYDDTSYDKMFAAHINEKRFKDKIHGFKVKTDEEYRKEIIRKKRDCMINDKKIFQKKHYSVEVYFLRIPCNDFIGYILEAMQNVDKGEYYTSDKEYTTYGGCRFEFAWIYAVSKALNKELNTEVFQYIYGNEVWEFFPLEYTDEFKQKWIEKYPESAKLKFNKLEQYLKNSIKLKRMILGIDIENHTTYRAYSNAIIIEKIAMDYGYPSYEEIQIADGRLHNYYTWNGPNLYGWIIEILTNRTKKLGYGGYPLYPKLGISVHENPSEEEIEIASKALSAGELKDLKNKQGIEIANKYKHLD